MSLATCVSLEMCWWVQFNESREKKLWELFRNFMLTVGFDALGKIPGHFDNSMIVTILHDVMEDLLSTVTRTSEISLTVALTSIQAKNYINSEQY